MRYFLGELDNEQFLQERIAVVEETIKASY